MWPVQIYSVPPVMEEAITDNANQYKRFAIIKEAVGPVYLIHADDHRQHRKPTRRRAAMTQRCNNCKIHKGKWNKSVEEKKQRKEKQEFCTPSNSCRGNTFKNAVEKDSPWLHLFSMLEVQEPTNKEKIILSVVLRQPQDWTNVSE